MIKLFTILSTVGAVLVASSIALPVGTNLFKSPPMTKADFDREFADLAAMSGKASTPSDEQKFRELGWRLISQYREGSRQMLP